MAAEIPSDPNAMPSIDLFPRLSAAGRFLLGLVRPTQEAPLYMSNYYNPDHFTGAAAMIDAELYDELPEGIVLGED